MRQDSPLDVRPGLKVGVELREVDRHLVVDEREGGGGRRGWGKDRWIALRTFGKSENWW